MDGVLSDLGWIRYTDKFPVIDGQLNADYLGENSVGELKIFEEEGLLKKERQSKVAELMKAYRDENKVVDLDVESLPREVRSQFENLISKPFQTAIKKAAKQMMKDQMNPELWKDNLPPVQSICFERDGITYLREAPKVSDSRFAP